MDKKNTAICLEFEMVSRASGGHSVSVRRGYDSLDGFVEVIVFSEDAKSLSP
ncbi:hypothetical protein [Eisenibacter elegans]|uniref:hypothetical protein n=1 Tax=Eisenibacter elegans TaxID=997 RepID=UPI0004116DDF|nr:hypothetical protein [Eisenibacter elegans]